MNEELRDLQLIQSCRGGHSLTQRNPCPHHHHPLNFSICHPSLHWHGSGSVDNKHIRQREWIKDFSESGDFVKVSFLLQHFTKLLHITIYRYLYQVQQRAPTTMKWATATYLHIRHIICHLNIAVKCRQPDWPQRVRKSTPPHLLSTTAIYYTTCVRKHLGMPFNNTYLLQNYTNNWIRFLPQKSTNVTIEYN